MSRLSKTSYNKIAKCLQRWQKHGCRNTWMQRLVLMATPSFAKIVCVSATKAATVVVWPSTWEMTLQRMTLQPLLNYSNGVVETLGLQIKSQNFVIIVLYRQPDDSIGGHRSTNAEFTQALEEIKKALAGLPSPSPDIVLCGDFNLSHIQWATGTLRPGATTDEQNMVKNLQDLTEEHFLFQHIHKATHRHGNTLDLCFSNNPAFIHSYECVATQLSDHYIIEGRTTHGAALQKTMCHRPNSSDSTSSVFDE